MTFKHLYSPPMEPFIRNLQSTMSDWEEEKKFNQQNQKQIFKTSIIYYLMFYKLCENWIILKTFNLLVNLFKLANDF